MTDTPLSRFKQIPLLFNIFYGSIFVAHFVQFVRFALEQEYTPNFSLILLVSLYLIHARWQALFARAEYCVQGGLPFGLVGMCATYWVWNCGLISARLTSWP
jgi:hypothetical protein